MIVIPTTGTAVVEDSPSGGKPKTIIVGTGVSIVNYPNGNRKTGLKFLKRRTGS